MPNDPNLEQPTDSVRETVTMSELAGTEEAAETEERQSTTIGNLTDRLLPSFHTPPSWIEWFGAQLAFWILVVIGVLVVLFVIIWWATLPSMQDISAGLKPSDSTQLVTAYNQIRESHTKWVTDFFQAVVVSTLVPIFTLLAGYVFGSQRQEAGKNDGDANNQ